MLCPACKTWHLMFGVCPSCGYDHNPEMKKLRVKREVTKGWKDPAKRRHIK